MTLKTFGGKNPTMQEFLGNFIDDENIYAQEVREILMEEGQLSNGEAGFMAGYSDSYPGRLEDSDMFFDDEEIY